MVGDYRFYLREFMRKNRRKMIRPWNPPQNLSFDQIISELISRISPPWDDPFPVLTEWIQQKLREAATVIPPNIILKGGIGGDFTLSASPDGHPSLIAMKGCIRDLYELFDPDEIREVILLSYLLHCAQVEDMQKDPSASYPMEDIYLPVLLKAAMTRLTGISETQNRYERL